MNTTATRARVLDVRRRVTELLIELDADQVEQTPESQAWAALADAHLQLTLALAFVDVADSPQPAKLSRRRLLRLVR